MSRIGSAAGVLDACVAARRCAVRVLVIVGLAGLAWLFTAATANAAETSGGGSTEGEPVQTAPKRAAKSGLLGGLLGTAVNVVDDTVGGVLSTVDHMVQVPSASGPALGGVVQTVPEVVKVTQPVTVATPPATRVRQPSAPATPAASAPGRSAPAASAVSAPGAAAQAAKPKAEAVAKTRTKAVTKRSPDRPTPAIIPTAAVKEQPAAPAPGDPVATRYDGDGPSAPAPTVLLGAGGGSALSGGGAPVSAGMGVTPLCLGGGPARTALPDHREAPVWRAQRASTSPD